jgi:4'-phosphopantetheinyl transferase
MRTRVTDFEILWNPMDLPLERGQTHVWAVRLDGVAPIAADGTAILSPEEVEKAKRFHFPRDQARFAAARSMLRKILGHYLRSEPAEVRFNYGPKGKPFLDSASSPKLHFNLSHSENLALIALTWEGPVGVDVERIRPLSDSEELAERFFCENENAALKNVRAGERFDAFFDLWTRKEALIKATGDGMTDEGIKIDTLSTEERSAHLVDIRPGLVSLSDWDLHRFEPAKGFRAALAVAAKNMEVVTGLWADGLRGAFSARQ